MSCDKRCLEIRSLSLLINLDPDSMQLPWSHFLCFSVMISGPHALTRSIKNQTRLCINIAIKRIILSLLI